MCIGVHKGIEGYIGYIIGVCRGYRGDTLIDEVECWRENEFIESFDDEVTSHGRLIYSVDTLF